MICRLPTTIFNVSSKDRKAPPSSSSSICSSRSAEIRLAWLHALRAIAYRLRTSSTRSCCSAAFFFHHRNTRTTTTAAAMAPPTARAATPAPPLVPPRHTAHILLKPPCQPASHVPQSTPSCPGAHCWTETVVRPTESWRRVLEALKADGVGVGCDECVLRSPAQTAPSTGHRKSDRGSCRGTATAVRVPSSPNRLVLTSSPAVQIVRAVGERL